ncbi:hypothetical protein KNN17_07700 [Arthrobacter bambusae]|jgi:hypothetical protein|uniref:hypothetical protein n=1 Tax=Arthrobacter TaxID=1663 RepID=UPI001F510392|nr:MULTISPECIES: hypothetical protein [Arthrobacter]MCI0141461.1 hypothetical protein [Arthrobacter bambusae]MDQ0211679.1 hypothetical protein [Arthrobacter bambusae]MDQ0236245.1 hypothetical protein [Arthrobacter bambusae]UYY82310.1 hypothetical protein OIT41_04410 [Arthrobacter sp. YA7-1]
MPSLNEASAHIRAAHLLVRSAEEWDALSEDLLRSYDPNDNDKAEMLRESFVAAWRMVIRNLLIDPLNAIDITVTPAVHPWGIATLETAGRACEPLLCSPEGLPAFPKTSDIHGRPRLLSFEEVMAGYSTCLASLLR